MPEPESFPVCRGCGILAPSHVQQCPRCGTATGEHAAWVPFRADGTLSAAIEMEFQCRACGHWAPANFLDLDGSLGCAHCGIEQAFAAERFREVLSTAHDVADLAGPPAEGHPANRTEPIGADNPYARIGVTEDLHATELRGQDALDLKVRLRVSRGRPLCGQCQMPLELLLEQPAVVTTQCSYCQARADHALPAGAPAVYPPLVGVVADQHRSDCQRSETLADDAAGAVAIRCPSCHAPLTVSDASALATCPYCSTQSVIPARAWARAAGAKITTRLWFAVFRGPSHRRQRLAMEAVMDRQFQARARRARAEADAALASRARAGEPSARGASGSSTRQARRGCRWPVILLLVVLVGLVVISGVVIGAVSFLAKLAGTEGATKPARRTSSSAASRSAPPPRDTFTALSYCACSSQVDGKGELERIVLANRVDWDDRGTLELQVYLDVTGQRSTYLRLSDATAPPAHPDGVAIAIGMACDKDVVAFVSGNKASGWSARTGKLLWTRALSGRFDHPNPPPARKDQFSTWCAQLPPQAGYVTVDLQPGTRLRLRIADGQLAGS